jgi:hypothetical protein
MGPFSKDQQQEIPYEVQGDEQLAQENTELQEGKGMVAGSPG